MAAIAKTVLSDQIVDVLRKRIIAGGFDDAGPIRQDALAAELGVSKIPLREAFAKLEQEGLLISRANHGYFVSPLSIGEALDVFDLRLKLEPAATSEASVRRGEQEIEAARRAMMELNEATIAHAPALGALNRAYHLALVRPCRRPVTVQIIERLHFLTERYIVKYIEKRGRNVMTAVAHSDLFEAWAMGHARHVEALAAQHIQSALDDLSTELHEEVALQAE
jgi:DNA-binding GntR family transcriptional regulator